MYSAGRVIRRYSSELGDSENTDIEQNKSGADLTNQAARELESAEKQSFLSAAWKTLGEDERFLDDSDFEAAFALERCEILKERMPIA